MEVVWTKYAIESLFSLLSFIESKWGEEKAYEVRIQIQKEVSLLEKHPQIGARFAEKDIYLSEIRTLLVKKKNKIFYTLIENKVFILLVWDVRQDPSVLETLLNQYLK